ncbi:Nucleoside 2-deoxyribosyltransferase [Paraliobacillus sp. PM-2]|uniref:nucleoside 2-deoxyribosyltransferase n=1 Tax=Paraliobacillus sp. PM-2 TaxID=1462524 RepID=UPI00061CCB2D|nr:nucleoside 2-deoxyribosyltransferase [Paraliobacillus sp. PM-2]CQR47431.1 Nucleoside 2-deoxyribosyltransferase [Paraliobacillus sp. PM-2]
MNLENSNVYLAGGWFNDDQLRRIEEAEFVLSKLGFNVFSPRKQQNEHLAFGSKEWRELTFTNDIKHIDWADMVFAIYDEEDAGTMFEIGYAYATNKPIFVYHETDSIVNLMISDSLQAYFKTFQDVLAYNWAMCKHIPYEGKVE